MRRLLNQRLRERREQILAWSGRACALLIVLAALFWRLSAGGSAFAEVPWALSTWMPGLAATATQGGSTSSQPPVPPDLPLKVRAFLQLALPYARQAHRALGWQTSVILAQWGLEHGWHVPDAQGYNWGNTEHAPGCARPGRFCYAPTPAEGLREYLYAAGLLFYDGVRAAVPQGADAVAVALGRSPWDAGHYTADGHPGDSLLAIMRRFNLYRFDRA